MTEVGKCTRTIETAEGQITVYSLRELEEKGIIKDLSKMPYSIKVIVESMLRQRDGRIITDEDVLTAASWNPTENTDRDIPWIPARVLLQDLTGGAAVTDLASMRNAVQAMGKDPELINPLVPVDLVIDHSINTDFAGRDDALELNEKLDFERNQERYALFKWAQRSFKNFRAVPPGNGICHQVNLEYLSPLVHVKEKDGQTIAYPDSCFGTDSHTTQIDGLGVVGWGVGGIEAEAVMVGQPSYMKLPDVIGFRLTNKLRPGITATDLVLTVVQMLRKKGVVGKFVEFFGPGYKNLCLADRATIANMGPEYGATMGYCPVDEKTIEYLRLSGRDEAHIDTIEKYMREQTMWYEGEPEYTDTLELDLSTVEPCLAGHKRPQDRILLSEMKEKFAETLDALGVKEQKKPVAGQLGDGSLVIASITSCTNTANPSVMIAAGLVAKKAADLGLKPKDYVKTSLAPGSRVVTEYLRNSGLLVYLEKLGFQVCGYGCMTCIGNSGPLSDEVSNSIKANDLAVAAIASSNRNFEGRIHPLVKANYLASPPLVVAFAIAGRVDIDMDREPLATVDGKDIYLKDIWPSDEEIQKLTEQYVTRSTFISKYRDIFKGSARWDAVKCEDSPLFGWDENSTYIRNPPFFDDIFEEPKIKSISRARCLAKLGDSITTDHISPAGAFSAESDAGRYLISKGVAPKDFNSYGSRRANHEIMVRGTFANVRLRNQLVPGSEGSWSKYLPENQEGTIFETSQRYEEDMTPLIVLAGKEYGTGSSRDWAAKGPLLLGVKAVIAESFERIHRSNLVGM
ncbi:MAG: aconitate hydratase AcnA, partial [Candidatus Methanomethylophilaceae archaeon]|nr:aconitate hydratase AcnA [Candidatus Methanomethylophilaceae archaeon]